MTGQAAAFVDATDLDALRLRLRASPDAPARHPIGLRRVEIGPDALGRLPDAIGEVRRAGPVVLVVDETPMTRAGDDLKATTARDLQSRFDVRTAIIRAQGPELHADEDALAQAERAVRGAGCVVSVGSGTITDVVKEATRRAGSPPWVAVQTAVSVNAFSDDMAVLLRDGVKRTVRSRWPDVLIVDLSVIVDAPASMNRAGFGELCAMFTAPADWYLAGSLGLDAGYDEGIVALFRDGAEDLLAGAPRVAANDPGVLAELAARMTLTGIAMGVAGRTAPLSGTEHLLSHLLDMAAERQGRALAFHGSQVGVASVLAATIWNDTLTGFDPARLRADGAYPSADVVERDVRTTFAALDPGGRMADECWRDVAKKLSRWHARRSHMDGFIDAWPDHRARLEALVVEPGALATALASAGAAAKSAALEPPPTAETVRWALRALPLMRDRFTVVDLRYFTGDWGEADVDRLLEASSILKAAA
jgi:glycerol-1-phosphate dehydrogenase [NAD(P)+]